jgi:hypothetical protein
MSYKDPICYYDFGWYKCTDHQAFGIKLLFWNGTITSQNSEAGGCLFCLLYHVLVRGKKKIQLLLLVLTNSYLFQEKVACLADNDARLALDPNDKYKIQVPILIEWSLLSRFKLCEVLLLFLCFRVCISLTSVLWLADKATWAWRCSFSSLFKWFAWAMVCLLIQELVKFSHWRNFLNQTSCIVWRKLTVNWNISEVINQRSTMCT